MRANTDPDDLDAIPVHLLGSSLGSPVGYLGLSVKTLAALEVLEIRTVRDLILRSEADLLSSRAFGLSALREIGRRLALAGLSLRVT